MDALEQKAMMVADELIASEEGRKLIKGYIAKWELEGFAANLAGEPKDSEKNWSLYHKVGWQAAETLKGVAK